jgi:hypothetical protein
VHGEDFFVNDGGDRQAVEAVGEGFPQLDVVSSFTLVVKPVDTVDGGTLVVASQDEKVFRVFDFVGQQQADGFQGLFTSVDIVTKEKVVCLWGEAAVLKQTEKVVVLAVDISTNLYRSLKLKQYRLLDKDFSCFGAQVSDFLFTQGHLFARP